MEKRKERKKSKIIGKRRGKIAGRSERVFGSRNIKERRGRR